MAEIHTLTVPQVDATCIENFFDGSLIATPTNGTFTLNVTAWGARSLRLRHTPSSGADDGPTRPT
ncbi:MAG: hypothetical protein KC609_19325 [Myxococcales bacterium]|nr:hypothetical protein [Myxococcales bacterium]